MIAEDTLVTLAKGAVAGFFALLVLAFVPQVNALLQGSTTALLGYVLAMFACALVLVGALVRLNQG